ncbi:MAG: cyclomaltodextrinase N-terminal domain-containing protein [Ignavibacteriaceae bacterium]|nr:cyclomaltodextrinase N-terminal domain-containing protein [Ignavibacteriaceae bacterium]
MILRIYFSSVILITTLAAQSFKISKIEPPNWWTGMKNTELQLMVYGENLSDIKVKSSNSKLKIKKITSSENSSYIFVDLSLKNIKADRYKFVFSKGAETQTIEYPILERQISPNEQQGFSTSDVIYLIMADRFCDGNPSNNKIDDSLDQFTSDDLDGRKGGDIEGIISKFDYLKELGVSTIWVTPMLENNMWMSYHGYAATDLYRIDPRFGTNEQYKSLVDEAHKRGLKVIMDHVCNHIGINHHWIKKLPFANWINGTVENHLPANHHKMTFPDPYSPGEAIDLTWNGWFTDYMVDLNQADPYLKRYLIQNAIWWIEYSGIDGIREDTYPYCNQYAMAEWNKAILNEYPKFNIVGEIWTGVPAYLAAYQQKNKFGVHLDSNLPCVTDFALADAFRDYLNGRKGLEGIFTTLAQDYLYHDPNNLLTFFDNHDISRALFIADEDLEKYKIALTILLTTRGIPKIFYGSEIGIVGDDKHGNIRSTFPGGFSDDSRNAFDSTERTEYENEIYEFTKFLLQIRKKYKSLSQGKLIHFYPFDNLYTYFRETNDEATMVIVNANDEEVEVDLNKYHETLGKTQKLRNIKTQEVFDITQEKKIKIGNKIAEIFLLIKN